ncbi:zinc finger CCCH domain-containing protein 15-like isoform X2 [Dendronephthya gigantea]|uniref:zinc finger CCCH domain-containing protein 15-like isoform X2 n=1 Tax=Dendronephthya gigantea TaxID=151771 RepID=UPI00106B0D77|nr:zinc finger CCCH domain-containing protein 15-like isoform X2 [Dendronephthya gigantea]
MPPKKKGQDQSNKKTVNKQKEKIIEDKTFGLKNKKGKKQQQYVKNVTQQVKFGGNPSARKLAQETDTKKLDQERKKKEAEELNQLFKPVATNFQGCDPKSVVCAYFKQGLCGKGDKCKYSHDINLERKGEKRSLYVDSRDDELQKDTMDTWDQQKLEEVVEKKHGEKEKKNTTEIVCKYFLEAIDKGLYGWFWNCPNGEKCIYRHALPPGFILKKKEQKQDKDEISLEELIEEERAKLGTNLTKITLETFTTWKTRKLKEKKATYESETKKKKEAFKMGRIVGKISGREVFQFRPELVDDDGDDEEGESFDITQFRRDEDDDDDENDTKVVDISLDSFNTLEYNQNGTPTTEKENTQQNMDTDGLEMACAVTADDTGQTGPTIDGVPVDQSLFEDLDDLDLDDDMVE